MQLRYAGTCIACGCTLNAGSRASYDSGSKTVTCLDCLFAPTRGVAQTPLPAVFAGTAGGSAQRKFEQLKTSRENRIRSSHPVLGNAILALTEQPQTVQAWATGARGEELLGRRLDALVASGILVLHDRRIPGTRANIDHIAIGPSGVFVIDAKKYNDRPTLRVEGGIIRPRLERLLVGGRDCTKLVEGVRKPVNLVESVLERVRMSQIPVRGMLCFVEADWPLFGGDFTIAETHVLWPRKAAAAIQKAGEIGAVQAEAAYRLLASALPPA